MSPQALDIIYPFSRVPISRVPRARGKAIAGIYTLKGWLTCTATITSLVTLCLSTPALGSLAKAQKLLKNKRYMAAAPEYYKVFSYPKNPAEKNTAIFGLARALENSGLPYSASKFYSLVFLQSPQGPNFKKAMAALGRIDNQVGLGRAHATQLLSQKIRPSSISGAARGFYFYYKGLEDFSNQKYSNASKNFSRVNSTSNYYYKSQFHLGVISTLSGSHARAIRYFQESSSGSPTLRTQSILNMARVYYEKKQFRKAFRQYANIQRDDDYWLDTIFESAWAFFILKKHNNVLGNIHTLHSPFYSQRFYPESYVLQAITFLRLCRFPQVKQSQRSFKATYKPINVALRRLLSEYRGRPSEFFSVVKSFRNGSLKRYKKAWPIIDYLSRTNIFKAAHSTVIKSDQELSKISNTPTNWRNVGLEDELSAFLNKKREAAMLSGGSNLISAAEESQRNLRELSSQTDFIQLEMNLGKIDKLRAKLKVTATRDEERAKFIGGLQELKVGQELEYWPFQGEYWEDELGGYVYNIDSRCEGSSNES